jgi:hypothetical protein
MNITGLVFIVFACFFVYSLAAGDKSGTAVMFVALLMLCCLGGCAAMPNTWTKENQRLEAAYQVVHVVDLGQTLDIKNHPGLKENNWFMGTHPSDGKIAVWYIGTAWGHAFVTSALENERAPRWLCRSWEVLTIGDALNNVRGNYQLGLKVKF